MKYNYKCIMAKNGSKMYYKNVRNKWKRITNKVGEKAEKKYRGQGMSTLFKPSDAPVYPLEVGEEYIEKMKKLPQPRKDELLFEMIEDRDIDAINSLLKAGANIETIDKDGYTPLRDASHNGFLEVVEFLLENGADIYASDEAGRSSLSIASRNGYDKVVKVLLEKDPGIKNMKDIQGETPLHVASFWMLETHPKIIDLLLKAGADTEIHDNRDATPLYNASFNGNVDGVKLLLKAGANVNAVNKEGETPLHNAILGMGDLETIGLLLEAGANVNAVNEKGETPYDLARKQKEPEIITFISTFLLKKRPKASHKKLGEDCDDKDICIESECIDRVCQKTGEKCPICDEKCDDDSPECIKAHKICHDCYKSMRISGRSVKCPMCRMKFKQVNKGASSSND